MGMKAAFLVWGWAEGKGEYETKVLDKREGRAVNSPSWKNYREVSSTHMSKRAQPPTEQNPTKTYQFRVYPTRKQEHTLEQWLVLCCETYNAALDERKSAYRIAGVSRSYEDQCAELPACKAVRPDLASVPSQVLQDVLKRVDLAFQAFFGRVEAGKKPGFPRFKSRWRYHSLTFKQFGNSFKIHEPQKKKRGMLELAKLGQVKMVMHRAIQGTRDLGHCQTDIYGQVVREYHGATVRKGSPGKVSASCRERSGH